MEYPVLRARDIGLHRFGVVDVHPAWNPAIEKQRPRKGIQHHLLGFAGIGHGKGLAAVAQAEMGKPPPSARYCPAHPVLRSSQIAAHRLPQNAAG